MNLVRLAKGPVARRLISGFGANMLGKIWALLIQLLSVPVLTVAWGGGGYGVWLMISTVPTFIALSDFGLGTAAGVDMTRSISRSDTEGALRAYQSVWVFLTLVTGAVCGTAVAGALIWGYAFPASEPGAAFTHQEIALTAAICIAYAFVSMQTGIQRIVFQATNKYAFGTFLYDIWFLIGGLGVIAAAWCGRGIVSAALALLISRVIGNVVTSVLLRRSEPWARQGWRHADRATLRRLMQPSMAALSLTLANSFGLQGVVLTVGWFLGPVAAATFGTCRMLTRIPLQLSGLVTRASLPELIRAQAADNASLTRRLMQINIGLSVAAVAPIVTVLTIFGNTILARISHGKLHASVAVFALLGAGAVLSAAWSSLGSLLMAENRQGSYGYLALIVYLASAATPFVFRADLTPTLLVLCGAEVVILLRVVQATAKFGRAAAATVGKSMINAN